jgi:hypothetical protein
MGAKNQEPRIKNQATTGSPYWSKEDEGSTINACLPVGLTINDF